MDEEGLSLLLAGVVGGLALIVAVAAFSRRTGVAAPLILIVVGAAASYLPPFASFSVPPSLILTIVLPPILYASAVNLSGVDLRRNIRPIAGLAVILVLLSSVAVGTVLFMLVHNLSLYAAFAVGAVVSPTDAVAATSIGRRLGLPERLLSILEGESLVNDATSLVLLRGFTGAVAAGTVNLLAIGGQFLWAVAGAVGVGLVVGFVTVAVRRRIPDPVLTTAISFAVPFLAYLPAERIGASGVLATVVAGVVTGVRGGTALGGSQRVNEHTNWLTVQFVLEHAVFLVMGLEFHHLVAELGGMAELSLAVGLGLLVVAMLLVLRVAYVLAELPLLRAGERRALARDEELAAHAERLQSADPGDGAEAVKHERAERAVAQRRSDLGFLQSNGLSWRGGLVVGWAGMRGVVTLAAAQSLPPKGFTDQPLLVLVAFTVAVVSLMLFGGTLPAVIRLSGVRGRDRGERRDEVRALLAQVRRSSLSLLDDPKQMRIGGTQADPRVLDQLRERYSAPPEDEMTRAEDSDTDLGRQFTIIQRRLRQAAREELQDVRAVGEFSTKAVSTAQDVLDTEDAREDRFRENL